MISQPLNLDEIEARAAAATPGPWFVETHAPTLSRLVCSEDGTLDINFGYVGNRTEPDAEFVAYARTDITAMAAEIRRLRDQLTAVTALCDEQDMAARLFELPTPEWIAAVRRAIEDATAASAAVRP
jgi:hypothetical protein